MSTSGSTRTPLTVKQNVDKRLRVLAELIYFGEQCGYYVGDRNAFFRVWTEENRNSRFSLIKKNMIEVDISDLSVDRLEEIRRVLLREKN